MYVRIHPCRQAVQIVSVRFWRRGDKSMKRKIATGLAGLSLVIAATPDPLHIPRPLKSSPSVFGRNCATEIHNLSDGRNWRRVGVDCLMRNVTDSTAAPSHRVPAAARQGLDLHSDTG